MSMVIYTLVNSGAEVCGIPHLPKPGRYPYFLYAVPKSATCAAFIKESRIEFLEANELHRKYGVWGTRHSLRIEISLPDPFGKWLKSARYARQVSC